MILCSIQSSALTYASLLLSLTPSKQGCRFKEYKSYFLGHVWSFCYMRTAVIGLGLHYDFFAMWFFSFSDTCRALNCIQLKMDCSLIDKIGKLCSKKKNLLISIWWLVGPVALRYANVLQAVVKKELSLSHFKIDVCQKSSSHFKGPRKGEA